MAGDQRPDDQRRDDQRRDDQRPDDQPVGEHRETGIGWPDELDTAPTQDLAAPAAASGRATGPERATVPEVGSPAVPAGADEATVPLAVPAAEDRAAAEAGPGAAGDRDGPGEGGPAPAGRVTSAGVMIAVLLAVLGFAIVVQFRNVSTDPTLAAARQEDLVRILSDLQAREQRLNADIAQLEASKRQLDSGVQGGEAALAEATRRADELGILAGSLPATGPGLLVRFQGNPEQLNARTVLDAVQELRGAGAEAMQIAGPDGNAVRIVASTYFLDGKGGIDVDGRLLTAPYTISVIGDPETMRTALNIPGGVVEVIGQAGGTVTTDEVAEVAVTARHSGSGLQYARPVS